MKRYIELVIICFLLGFFAFLAPAAIASSQVKGHIGVFAGPQSARFLSGWACQTGNATPIEVRLYVGGPVGTGTFVRSVTANYASSSPVIAACNSPGQSHSFRIPLSTSELNQYEGQTLWVYGISNSGTSNRPLTKSGQLRFPESEVIGSVGGVQGASSNPYIAGWACQLRDNQSIRVHLYVGGRSGVGQYVKNATANISSESGISSACATSGVRHRYRIYLTEAELEAHQGKPIYVHGISTRGTGNNLLTSSGNHRIPEPLPPPVPSRPTISAPSVDSNGHYTVSWNAPTHADTYKLAISINGSHNETINLTSTSLNQNNKPRGIYGYKVQACNESGCSPYSIEKSVNVTQVIGYIDGFRQPSNNTYLAGWSCQTGLSTPIDVQLYVGGPPGSGTLLQQITTSVNTESGIYSSCGTSNVKHRFRFYLSDSELETHQGKSVYVQGLSPLGTGHKTLTRSGAYSIPYIQAPEPTVTAYWSPEQVEIGESQTLNWSSTDTDSCTVDGQSVSTSGTETITTDQAGTFSSTVQCTGEGGTASDTATRTVDPHPVPDQLDSNAISVQDDAFAWNTAEHATSYQIRAYDLDPILGGAIVVYEETTLGLSWDANSVLEDGTYWITVAACNASDVCGNESNGIEITLDTTLPTPGFNEDYEAFLSLTNGTSIVLTNNGQPSVGDIELVWDGATGSYSPQILGSTAGSWESIAIELVLGDFNLDGVVDVLLKDIDPLVSAIPDLLDLLVFSNPVVGTPPISATPLNQEFHSFFGDVNNWMQNPDYFDENAPLLTEVRMEPAGFGVSFRNFNPRNPIAYILARFEIEQDLDVCLARGNLCEIHEAHVPSFFEWGEERVPCGVWLGFPNVEELTPAQCNSPAIILERVQTRVEVQVPDYSDFNPAAIVFAEIFERAKNSDFSNDTDVDELEEILAEQLGVPSLDLRLGRDEMTDIRLGEDERAVSRTELNFRLFFQGINVIRINIGTSVLETLLDYAYSSDPEEWEPHFYGLESDICNVGEDTVVDTAAGPSDVDGPVATIVLGTIPAEFCTVENVFCWARRLPAPRYDESDTTLAVNEGIEELGGPPLFGRTDPITTWVDEDNFNYRNETSSGHLLHDRAQTEGCADFRRAPSIEDIAERCAFVDRRVSENSDGVIQISTHGEGHNPVEPFDFVEFNEVGGAQLFSDIDTWVQDQLINQGECPTTD